MRAKRHRIRFRRFVCACGAYDVSYPSPSTRACDLRHVYAKKLRWHCRGIAFRVRVIYVTLDGLDTKIPSYRVQRPSRRAERKRVGIRERTSAV